MLQELVSQKKIVEGELFFLFYKKKLHLGILEKIDASFYLNYVAQVDVGTGKSLLKKQKIFPFEVL
jgi:hypothetical protein